MRPRRRIQFLGTRIYGAADECGKRRKRNYDDCVETFRAIDKNAFPFPSSKPRSSCETPFAGKLHPHNCRNNKFLPPIKLSAILFVSPAGIPRELTNFFLAFPKSLTSRARKNGEKRTERAEVRRMTAAAREKPHHMFQVLSSRFSASLFCAKMTKAELIRQKLSAMLWPWCCCPPQTQNGNFLMEKS